MKRKSSCSASMQPWPRPMATEELLEKVEEALAESVYQVVAQHIDVVPSVDASPTQIKHLRVKAMTEAILRPIAAQLLQNARMRVVMEPEYIGECFHTAFRKGAPDSKAASDIHSKIREMPPEDWGEVVGWISWAMKYTAEIEQ